MLELALLILGAYFLGSVPFGLLVGKLKGIDVRSAGSGNIGATNVGRLLGKRYFWLVFALDAAKGAAPMLLGHFLVRNLPESSLKYVLWLLAGLAALLGHVFPIYLRFKGGKGVATALGVMLGVWPYYTITAIPAVSMFIGVFAVSRYISLSSVVGALIFPVILLATGWVFGWRLLEFRWPLVAFSVLIGLLIIWRHRANIARLRAGTEPRFGAKSASPPAGVPAGDAESAE